MRRSPSQSPTPLEVRSFIDRTPAFAWSAPQDGSLEFSNQTFRVHAGLSLAGLSSDQLHGTEWESAVYLGNGLYLNESAHREDATESRQLG